MGCCKKKPLKVRTEVPFPRDTATCQTPVCAVLFMICLLFMVVIGLWGWSENATVIRLSLFHPMPSNAPTTSLTSPFALCRNMGQGTA